MRTIGFVEFNSIAKGIESADAMLKTGQVEIIISRPICPGKYITMVWGDVAAVESAVKAGVAKGDIHVIDDFVLPNVHPQVIPACSAGSSVVEVAALGVLESFSVATMIVAADAAVKAGDVDLIEIRIGMGLGGKSFTTLTGDVAAVNSAVEAGSKIAADKGFLVQQVVIPSPHKNLISSIL
ncbi:BMC domain-containing protein [Dehalobacterium formicoaceticum]|uniref:BMC domain-containing protein n=1 Tax=Dehalobacterium formicoaceticum TaxID=51515 RepID=A0ABT1Y207_9FIRM|nr:BMC domain-containing protein [Dehalobacterium formicoaceticum]MCR6544902.1 BMC domain-containing protein [Dehalobacterium formicoaceticum]